MMDQVNGTAPGQVSNYELWASLDASGFAIYRLRQLELAPFHLTVEQAAVLRVLQSAGTVTPKILRDLTLRQQNTISILLARMLAAGLVASQRVRGQRETQVRVTERGRSLLEKLPADNLKVVFSVLEGPQRQAFVNSMLSLQLRARSLLKPEDPAFFQYIAQRKTPTIVQENDIYGAPPHYGLWSLLDSTRFALSRLREIELTQYGLTVEQASILRVIADAGQPVTARQLEEISLRQHHSVSVLIQRMAKAGIVARQKTPGERSSRVYLTEKGRQVLESLTAVALELTFSVLKEPDRQQLSACLRSLNRKARDMLRQQRPD